MHNTQLWKENREETFQRDSLGRIEGGYKMK